MTAGLAPASQSRGEVTIRGSTPRATETCDGGVSDGARSSLSTSIDYALDSVNKVSCLIEGASCIAPGPRPEGDLPEYGKESACLVAPNAPEDGARSETGAASEFERAAPSEVALLG